MIDMRIMGIVNVTPDSFSDGGSFLDPEKAISHGLKLIEEGADILDVGGESTRPGAAPVSIEEEISRVVPVIRELARSGHIISVDTRHAATMKAAIEAGAQFINDVNALQDDGALKLAASSGCDVCIMHMQGSPQTMQVRPVYKDVVMEIYDFLNARIEACLEAGISPDRIYADVGIGFGKSLQHNLDLLKNLDKFHELGVKLLLGASRKNFIEKIAGGASPDKRVGGSLSAALWAQKKRVSIVRVHDVHETRQALSVWNALSAE